MIFKKNWAFIFCAVLLHTTLLSQKNSRVLIILPDSANIQFDRIVGSVLDYNRKEGSALRSYVFEQLKSKSKSELNDVAYLSDIQELSFGLLNDSLNNYREWESFDIRSDSTSLSNNIQAQLKVKSIYLGRVVDVKTRAKIQAYLLEHDIQFVVMLNQFNTESPRPFDQKTYLKLHYELFNSQMQKVFGGQISEGYELKAKMNYEAFLFMLRNQIQFDFSLIKSQLKQSLN